MEPEELGPFILRYLRKPGATSNLNRYNFGLSADRGGGEVGRRLMEAWMWLEREGFLAPRPADSGQWVFVTRKGERVAESEDFSAYAKASLFPDDLDAILVRNVKPLFVRGDYDTAVFRAFKEVETRVRAKAGFGPDAYGRDLMVRAFGTTGPLTDASMPRGEQDARRELFAGAISSFKNPSSHRDVQFESAREAMDMICFANQLLRIVDRL